MSTLDESTPNGCWIGGVPLTKENMTWLVVWTMTFIFPLILGMSSSQLLLTHIFQRGWLKTTNQLPFWEPTILINLGVYSSIIYPNNWWEQFYSSTYPILGFITPINLGNNHVNIMGEHRSNHHPERAVERCCSHVLKRTWDIAFNWRPAVLFLQRGIQPKTWESHSKCWFYTGFRTWNMEFPHHSTEEITVPTTEM